MGVCLFSGYIDWSFIRYFRFATSTSINNIGRKSNIIIASISSEKTIYNSLKLFRKKGINTYCL